MDKEQLDAARRELGLSADQLAEALGVSRRTLFYRLSGEQPIRASEAKAIDMMLAACRAAREKSREGKTCDPQR